MHFIPKGVDRAARNATVQCTPTFHRSCYKSQEIGGEHILGTIPVFETKENFRKVENRSVILCLAPRIKPKTPRPAVAIATTRPTRHEPKSIT